MNIETIQMVSMNILTSAVLDYIENLPVIFYINLFNILNNDNCLPTLFAKLQESCMNSKVE